MIFGVEKSIWVKKKSRKSYWTLIFYHKIIAYKTTSDVFRTIWAFKTRELSNEQLFCYTEVRSAGYHYSFLSQYKS